MAAAVVGPPTLALEARASSRNGSRNSLPTPTRTPKWTAICPVPVYLGNFKSASVERLRGEGKWPDLGRIWWIGSHRTGSVGGWFFAFVHGGNNGPILGRLQAAILFYMSWERQCRLLMNLYLICVISAVGPPFRRRVSRVCVYVVRSPWIARAILRTRAAPPTHAARTAHARRASHRVVVAAPRKKITVLQQIKHQHSSVRFLDRSVSPAPRRTPAAREPCP